MAGRCRTGHGQPDVGSVGSILDPIPNILLSPPQGARNRSSNLFAPLGRQHKPKLALKRSSEQGVLNRLRARAEMRRGPPRPGALSCCLAAAALLFCVDAAVEIQGTSAGRSTSPGASTRTRATTSPDVWPCGRAQPAASCALQQAVQDHRRGRGEREEALRSCAEASQSGAVVPRPVAPRPLGRDIYARS